MRDAPDGRLFAVPDPVASLAFLDRIPRRFVLPMVIAAANDQPRLVPNDLGADGKTSGFKASLQLGGMQRSMPHIGNDARKQCPGLPPVGLVVVEDFTDGECANPRAVSPAHSVA